MKLIYLIVFFNVNCFAMGDPYFIPANPVHRKPMIEDMSKTGKTLNIIDSKKNRQSQEYIKQNCHEKQKRKLRE